MRWLESRKDQRPFLSCIHFHEPHHPVAPPAALIKRYAKVARNTEEATYFASVHSIDAAVGRYLAKLDALGLAENTIVVFTSDHGPQARGAGVFRHSYGRSTPFRGTKRTLFEGGLRVPCLVRWPKRIAAGSKSAAPVGFVDVLPTLADACGFAVPERELDGESVLPVLLGKALDRRKPLHFHFYAPRRGPQSMLRSGRFALTAQWSVAAKAFRGGTRRIPQHEAAIRKATLQDFRLYDVVADPRQQSDVAAAHPAVVRELSKQLRAKLAAVQADAPTWQASPKKLPNILFIVSEDNGPELGCYGDPFVRTPTLDAMAKRGVRFERAFVPYSVCSPSRACFLTGLWPQQNGHLGLATHRFGALRGDGEHAVLLEDPRLPHRHHRQAARQSGAQLPVRLSGDQVRELPEA